MSRVWRWLSAALGLVALGAMWLVEAARRDRDAMQQKAARYERMAAEAEQRLADRQRAERASAEAEHAGAAAVEAARAHARAGRRDHFSSGMQRRD